MSHRQEMVNIYYQSGPPRLSADRRTRITASLFSIHLGGKRTLDETSTGGAVGLTAH